MPKSCRCGQSEILDACNLDNIMLELSHEVRAVLSTCRFIAARINESLSLKLENVTLRTYPRRAANRNVMYIFCTGNAQYSLTAKTKFSATCAD